MSGVIFNIQRNCIHDGPGIRTNIFMKGCPLRCKWCCNPESQSVKPEIAYFKFRCVGCKKCVESCPEGAIFVNEQGEISLKQQKCTHCGACVSCCPKGAWKLYGTTVSAQEVLEEALRDEPFYRKSGGGITFTGGEPLMQPEFLGELIEGAKKRGVHIAIETSAYASWSQAGELLRQMDFVMVDIKHMNSNTHRALTGVDNQIILDNIEHIAQTGVPMTCRIPLIPGINDSPENLRETACFIRSIGGDSVVLLPFHQYGAIKYDYLDRNYALTELKAASDSHVEAAKAILLKTLSRVSVGGDGLADSN